MYIYIYMRLIHKLKLHKLTVNLLTVNLHLHRRFSFGNLHNNIVRLIFELTKTENMAITGSMLSY